jgi:hypothetical protein
MVGATGNLTWVLEGEQEKKDSYGSWWCSHILGVALPYVFFPFLIFPYEFPS